MVSLENRTDYSLRINESPKLTAFNNLLLNKVIIFQGKQELHESEEIYFGVVNALQTNEKGSFENYYNKKNTSRPSKESPSPFVNDDFLIFSLIVGIFRYGLDKSWIKNIVSIRNRNIITNTFENILNEDYYSKSNLYEIVIMYLQLNDSSLITNDLLNNTFKSINGNTALFENKSDFQIICAIRAYDLIIERKVAPDGSEINLLQKFNSAFVKRIRLLSWFLQTIILTIILYAAIELVSYNPKIKELFDRIGSALKIFGLVGFSQLGNIIPFIKRELSKTLMRIFGYPEALLKEIPKKEGN